MERASVRSAPRASAAARDARIPAESQLPHPSTGAARYPVGPRFPPERFVMPRVLPPPAVAERYVQALGEVDPIESQRKAPKRLRKLVKGLSPKQLARRPEPGKWSIKEV